MFDSEVRGFGIRKYADGKAFYIVKFSHRGKQRRQSLGEVTRGNLKAMRLLASDAKAQARQGRDILAERAAEREAIKNRRTFGSLVPEYLKVCEGRLRPRTHSETARYLRKAWAPLHGRDIKTITRSDVVGVIDALERDGGSRSADCARVALATFFNWALDRNHCDANPVFKIGARAKSTSRERTLNERELRAVWHAAGDDDYGRIVKLLILTGQRRTEIGDLRWDEINAAGREIRLPRERCKNDKAHTIPLSDQSLALLPKRRDGHEHLFGRLPGSGFSGWSKGRRELDERIAAARQKAESMPPWVLHDLRRTAATGLQKLGVRLEVTEALLNHVSGSRGGIVGVYQRYGFTDEARAALEAWGRQVTKIVR